MYVSDYGYAAAPSAWTKKLSYDSGNGYSNSEVTSVNWMYMGLIEWTISPYSSNSGNVWLVFLNGGIDDSSAYSGYGQRPVLYLKANTKYQSGDGTQDKPIILGE